MTSELSKLEVIQILMSLRHNPSPVNPLAIWPYPFFIIPQVPLPGYTPALMDLSKNKRKKALAEKRVAVFILTTCTVLQPAAQKVKEL